MSERVLGVLGGMDLNDDRLVAWAKTAHTIYAADSGANRLIALGFRPIVVGDFDSFTMFDQAEGLRLEQIPDADTTDCDKLLMLAHQDGCDALTLTCIEGDLPDHVLASFSSVVASNLRMRIAFRRGIGHVVRPEHPADVPTRAGQRVSLMPLIPCEGATLSGTVWRLDEARIGAGGLVSVSNEATSDEVKASVSDGCALLFIETSEVSW